MIAIPYGKSHLDVAFPYNGLLTSRVDELKSDRTGRELVEEAMASPMGTPTLAALAAGKKRCTIIISDHTRLRLQRLPAERQPLQSAGRREL